MNIVPQTPWLYPEEQAEIILRLYEWGLLKFDNKRELPLKMGGTTDVYINLRDARNNPQAIKFIAELFSHPLRRLGVDRFVEVPDSVSCFAGPLSIETNIPYLTIREQEKGGRVGDARTIGRASVGEKICIIDDVITDGGSKIVPYKVCKKLGQNTKALVVLVDRGQGWKENLAKHGIVLPVWPGMTLHDVRRHLIQTLGLMERCSKEAEDKNPIIVALDGKTWDEILPVIDKIRRLGCILKVNDLLFKEDFGLIPHLATYGRVMADTKSHDIPNTVANILRWLKTSPPWAVTVHASGGKEMVQAAVKALEGTKTKVLAVTVLTSMNEDYEEVYHRLPRKQVLALAKIAINAGADGLVCSPEEVQELRSLYPCALLVTPGIRSKGADAGDQKRVGTPKQAIDDGANHIVMGRQLFDAPDIHGEIVRVIAQELNISLF
jgi:orotidine-5'-phosphate decarboxylase